MKSKHLKHIKKPLKKVIKTQFGECQQNHFEQITTCRNIALCRNSGEIAIHVKVLEFFNTLCSIFFESNNSYLGKSSNDHWINNSDHVMCYLKSIFHLIIDVITQLTHVLPYCKKSIATSFEPVQKYKTIKQLTMNFWLREQ